MGTSFTELKLYLREAPFVISSHISPLHETLYACRVEPFAEASEIFARAVCHFAVVCETSSERILQGAENVEVGGC